uniref:Poly(A) polymerase n=1 Tax=Dermatophagoides pteronyssinus TaxID=6956 RepID=A0A6P6YDB4_DERPT|nr:poly(A) polymerase-like [Dermatophagoides pteronyssinus]
MYKLNLYESVARYKERRSVLIKLNKLLKHWVNERYEKLTGTETVKQHFSAKIFTFGSYRLGIISPNSDIDALCVVPNFITRHEFFVQFKNYLERFDEITFIKSLPDAYTPIMKLTFSGIDIDLLLASLALQNVSINNILDNNILKFLDDKSARSINGCRVNEVMFRLIPNKAAFVTVARFIKYWAKVRGIYSNVMGYFGGVAWMILITKICQLNPDLLPNRLLEKFYEVYSDWKWPKAVKIFAVEDSIEEYGFRNYQSWNPRINTNDCSHLMPIITPAFPSMNTTHNVSHTTMQVIKQEFLFANEILKTDKSVNRWMKLVKPFCLEEKYNIILAIFVNADDQQSYSNWQGWVESKVRFLFKSIEEYEKCELRPFPHWFDIILNNWNFSCLLGIGVELKKSDSAECINLEKPIQEFLYFINKSNERVTYGDKVGLRIKIMSVEDFIGFTKIK